MGGKLKIQEESCYSLDKSPYQLPKSTNHDIDWSQLKKALFQGIGKCNVVPAQVSGNAA